MLSWLQMKNCQAWLLYLEWKCHGWAFVTDIRYCSRRVQYFLLRTVQSLCAQSVMGHAGSDIHQHFNPMRHFVWLNDNQRWTEYRNIQLTHVVGCRHLKLQLFFEPWYCQTQGIMTTALLWSFSLWCCKYRDAKCGIQMGHKNTHMKAQSQLFRIIPCPCPTWSLYCVTVIEDCLGTYCSFCYEQWLMGESQEKKVP